MKIIFHKIYDSTFRLSRSVATFTWTLFASIRMNSFWLTNPNVVFTWTLNKVIGLICLFICHKPLIGFNLLTCAHCMNIQSFPLFSCILTYDTFIHREEQLVPRVIRHYAIFTSLHMQYFPVSVSIRSSVTCPLVRITKGINHPLQSDRNFNQIWPIQSDRHGYMWLFYSDCAPSPIMIGL